MHVIIITGRPRLIHNAGVMGWEVFLVSEAAKMLVVDPIIVPFPPKPAPNTKAHHKGATGIPSLPNPRMTGIRAIVAGTLSTTAENNAAIQRKIIPSKTGGRC